MTNPPPLEIELKLSLPPQQVEAFRRRMARRRGQPVQQDLVTRYFDTPDFALSAQGVALTKRMMWAGLETSSLRAAIELESHTQLFVRMTTKNFEEAVQARKEKRPPQFKD